MNLTERLNLVEEKYQAFLEHIGHTDHPAILLGFIVTMLAATKVDEYCQDPELTRKLIVLFEQERDRLIRVMMEINPE